MRPFKALFAAALAALHLSANASLINPDEYKTSTLTWLKLSETIGLSISDFNNGVGGWNSAYRLASSEEIAVMLQGLGVVEGDSNWRPMAPGAGAFVFQLGGTAPGSSYAGTWGFDGNQGANGIGLGWSVTAYLGNGDQGMPLSEFCPAYFSCSRIIATTGVQSPLAIPYATGLFVVRVPEPGSMALFGLAGALLAFQRRRNRK